MVVPTGRGARASIAAMPKRLRPILLALFLAASAVAAGCGNSGPDPSIPQADARILLAKIEEIKANVDVGSCLVASDKTDDLLADVANLPSGVNSDVQQALDNGANNLKLLLNDPSQCQGRTETTTTTESTTAPTTTEETTTERTEPTTTEETQTQPTTTTQTQTTPTQSTPGASGGIGPGQ
jgi:hypothetical protein